MFKRRKNMQEEETNDSGILESATADFQYQKDERDTRIAQLQAELDQTKTSSCGVQRRMDNMRRRHQGESIYAYFSKPINGSSPNCLQPLTIWNVTLSFIKPDEHTPLTEGIELVYKNFQKILQKNNVKPFEAIGKQFDVHLHDALMEEVRDDVEPGTITNEIQKGYMMGDDVLRHAKVIVAKKAE